MTQEDEKRYCQYELASGAHLRPEEGRCAMEWVAFLAGEPHSDSPDCVAPVLRAFCIRLNDSLGYGDRQKLRPYLARTIGTRDDGLDAARVWMCVDWLVRTYTPALLDLVGRTEAAAALRDDIPITSRGFIRDVVRVLRVESSELYRLLCRLRLPGYPANLIWAEIRDPASSVSATAYLPSPIAPDGEMERDVLVQTVKELARDVAIVLDSDFAPLAFKLGRVNRTNGELRASLFDLLDRMLPTEVIQLPVVSEWREVCGVPR